MSSDDQAEKWISGDEKEGAWLTNHEKSILKILVDGHGLGYVVEALYEIARRNQYKAVHDPDDFMINLDDLKISADALEQAMKEIKY